MKSKNIASQIVRPLFLAVILFSSCKKEVETRLDLCFPADSLLVSYIVGFDRPVGIAFSPAQKVAVTEFYGMDVTGNNYVYGQPGAVKVFQNISNLKANIPLKTITTVLAPEAVVFDTNENLYVTETEYTSGISVYAPPYTSNAIKTIQGNFMNPRGIAFDKAGNLYLAEDGENRILKITDPLGNDVETSFITGLSSPKAIAIDGDFIYIAEYTANRVSKYNINNPAKSVDTYSIEHPIDLQVTDCILYISSHGMYEGGYKTSNVVAVKKSNMNGGIQKEYAGFTGITFGVCSDQSGNLYVSDFTAGQIRKYSKY